MSGEGSDDDGGDMIVDDEDDNMEIVDNEGAFDEDESNPQPDGPAQVWDPSRYELEEDEELDYDRYANGHLCWWFSVFMKCWDGKQKRGHFCCCLTCNERHEGLWRCYDHRVAVDSHANPIISRQHRVQNHARTGNGMAFVVL
jgi:hypothetical protein